MYTTLISPHQLQALQASGAPLMVFDCSFDMDAPTAGFEQYLQTHIPGALHADLNRYLSSFDLEHAACAGRHPLPVRSDCVQLLRSIGFANDMQAVVYDRNGSAYCGRMWWMLQWLGHERCAVLDGGLQAWQAAGLPVQSGGIPALMRQPPAHYRPFTMGKPLVRLVSIEEVIDAQPQGGQTLVDARSAQRYCGDVEALDPQAGHIPGALNRPWVENFDPATGCFKSPERLRAEWSALLAQRNSANVWMYCGSGVTAIPNILSMRLAGLPCPALYAGGWSEWSRQAPALPVAKGQQ